MAALPDWVQDPHALRAAALEAAAVGLTVGVELAIEEVTTAARAALQKPHGSTSLEAVQTFSPRAASPSRGSPWISTRSMYWW